MRGKYRTQFEACLPARRYLLSSCPGFGFFVLRRHSEIESFADRRA